MLNCDCTENCKSLTQAETITSAITKRGVSDVDLCAYLSHICYRCESVTDYLGRNALHLAASCGRNNLVRWLVLNRKADLNLKDRESGYTALHRSIFYGKIHCAVELMKLGASLSITDLDGLTPIEHAMKDGLKPETSHGELFVLGSNNNNIFGSHESKKHPNLLDTFHKTYPIESVQQICIEQFHMVIVSAVGAVYSCGHGQGGRLGLNFEGSVTTPQKVTFPKIKHKEIACSQASISKDHSIFLCSDGNIYTCGSNTYKTLGHVPPPDQLLYPKAIQTLSKEICGVIACHYHSVAWGPEALYVWGLNIGQIGKKISDENAKSIMVNPRKLNVLNEMNLSCVAASNGATCFCTKKGDVYVYTEYNCKKIASKLLNVVQISVIGGKLNLSVLENEMHKKYEIELKVAVLTNTGNVLIWQQSDPQLIRCVYNINRAVVVKQIFLNSTELLMVSDHGEVFKGIVKPRKKRMGNDSVGRKEEKSAFHKFLEKDDCLFISLQKFLKTHRAVSVQSDPKGENYCIIQAHPYKDILDLADNHTQFKTDLEILLHDPELADVVLKVGDAKFDAHKFILASKCIYFQEIFSRDQQIENLIELDPISPIIFEQFLKFVYTGDCDLTKVGEIKDEKLKEICLTKDKSKGENLRNPVRLLHELAKKLRCSSLQDILALLTMEQHLIVYSKEGKMTNATVINTFNISTFKNLCDVTIECAEKTQQLRAHKCILAARLEYFRNMFSMRWNESQETKVTLPFPRNIVEIFLDYLYTDSLSQVDFIESDSLCKVLVLADHLFVSELKLKCEIVLSSMLTLKNTSQMFSFAHMYNAECLKDQCKKFIVLNLTAFLEMGYLNDLDEQLLLELSTFYYDYNELMWTRQITPYSTAVSDEIIFAISESFPKNLLDEIVEKSVQKKKSRSRRSSSPKRHNVSISESDNEDFKNSPVSGKKLEFVKENEVFSPPNVSFSHSKESLLSTSFGTSPECSFNYGSDFPELHNRNEEFHRKKSKHRIVRPPGKFRDRLISQSSDISMSPPETKGNPWKLIEQPERLSPTKNYSSINDIMSEEKQQKQNWFKVSNKLLQYTQMEDQAIGELDSFYNTTEVTDEIIIIERVHVKANAGTLWISNVR